MKKLILLSILLIVGCDEDNALEQVVAEVEQEINSKRLQVSESILGSSRMWDVDDNEIKGD